MTQTKQDVAFRFLIAAVMIAAGAAGTANNARALSAGTARPATNTLVFSPPETPADRTPAGVSLSPDFSSPSSPRPAAAPRGSGLFETPEFPYPSELAIIAEAARANGIATAEDWAILLAIRCAENGRAGRQFGVLHPRAIDTDLRTQAGWAAATVIKNRLRYLYASAGDMAERTVSPAPGRVCPPCPAAPDAESFIDFLAARYCPAESDPAGHENWKRNVTFFYKRFFGKG